MIKRNLHRAYSSFYYGLRIFLHKNQLLFRLAFVLRSYLALGPLRAVITQYKKTFCANKPFTADLTAVFPFVNRDQVVHKINELGYAQIDDLKESYVSQILKYCDANKRISYRNPHKDCEAVDHISRDAKIVEIARKYLGVEPILWLTRLQWTVPKLDSHGRLLPSVHVESENYYDDNAFHYDVHDVRSLTLFIYLSDIDADSCPHVLIEGTHKRKSLRQLHSRVIADEVAQKKYGNRIKVILGSKGTAFIEDTTCFHKVANGTKARLILSVHYVIQRRIPPEPPPPRSINTGA